ncbi:glycosyl hydrolase family 28 [Hydrogenispora ethanolica]|uniref:Glycosyl hydrolase family 28 n=1 Tax=Hydrogenispora ethanolica TaxID=1082276 RepID=A0A4R1R024_HYDET|nr:glycoside hydrolase family 28 protein [Hydrogenispora ethanolica]TCL58612.1 glycosyl hydrolase family 28 [Hydrogenispora ethanolica]
MATVYDIREYGAVGDGKFNNAGAIQNAIDLCHENGGGQVVIPAGIYLSGSIRLRSHIDLHLKQGAVLRCSLKREDIHAFDNGALKAARPDGWNDGCFIGAWHEENITISGAGTIDGQGREIMYDDDADGGFHEAPLMIKGFRPRLMLLEDIQNLTVKEVTLLDAAFWTLHLAGCRRVRIHNLQILNNTRGANNDGIDPDCCQDVLISNCIVKTGDDAIVIKSTRPMAEQYGNCENIIITGCILKSQDSALKIGTETHGTIRNVVFSDCIIEDCSRAVGIWVRDGGTVEDIQVHHLTGAVRRYADAPQREFAPRWWGKGEPLFISATHRTREKRFPGVIRNIQFDHIHLKSESGVFIAAEADCPIENVSVSELDLTLAKQGSQPGGLFDEQPSVKNVYPHAIPAVYARYVNGLRLKECRVRKVKPPMEHWSGLTETENCRDLALDIQEVE